MSFTDVIKKSVLEGFRTGDLSTTSMAITLGIAVAMGLFIYVVYRLTAKGSFYNRGFNKSLATLPVITAGIMLAMQSNLVISLGMVGALSIVRFRTAVKDPMDLMFLFWSISVGIICGAGLAQVAVILSVVVTAGILILDRMPVAKAPMILVVNSTDLDAEASVCEAVRKYAKFFTVKSRNMTAETLDLVVELRTEQGSSLIRDVMKIQGITSASLLAHDGEVTF